MTTTGVGRRVAEERKLAWLTQNQLATRADVSVSLVKAVEQGRAPASPTFVSAVSRALGIGVADLLDQPFARQSSDERQLYSVVPALRREMAAYLLPPSHDMPPRSLDELARDVDQAARLRHKADLTGLGATLSGLLEELRAATHLHSGSERERAFGLLGEAYCAAWQVVYKLGYLDLASLTEDRYEWAAARCGDELAMLRGDGAPRERVGHYWMDLARGWLLHGDRERALASLIKARHTAPQQTRYHPMVHETVRMLARPDRLRSDTVAAFAAWCGIS